MKASWLYSHDAHMCIVFLVGIMTTVCVLCSISYDTLDLQCTQSVAGLTTETTQAIELLFSLP